MIERGLKNKDTERDEKIGLKKVLIRKITSENGQKWNPSVERKNSTG